MIQNMSDQNTATTWIPHLEWLENTLPRKWTNQTVVEKLQPSYEAYRRNDK